MNNVNDDRVGAPVLRSTTYAWANRLRAWFVNVLSNSRVYSIWQLVAHTWAASSWTERRRAGGTAVVVASLWHVLLLLTLGEFASWLVFVVPAIAGFIGALAIVTTSPWLARR